MSIPIFNTPRLVAVSLPRNGSPLPFLPELGISGVSSCRDLIWECSYYIQWGLGCICEDLLVWTSWFTLHFGSHQPLPCLLVDDVSTCSRVYYHTQVTSTNNDFDFLLLFACYSQRIFWFIFTILPINHICGASLEVPVAVGFSFSSFAFVFRLATLMEMSFQSTFATRLTSCWAIRVFTKMPGSATSVAVELWILPRTFLFVLYAVYICRAFFFSFHLWSFCSHCSELCAHFFTVLCYFERFV